MESMVEQFFVFIIRCFCRGLSRLRFECVGHSAQVYMGRDVVSGKVVERFR